MTRRGVAALALGVVLAVLLAPVAIAQSGQTVTAVEQTIA